MKDSTISFYDELSEEYHLIFDDWYQTVLQQGQILDQFICSPRVQFDNKSKTLLDASCGIGTQAIGLARLGYNVTATDISPQSVARGVKEAEKAGVAIHFGVADFRTLQEDVEGEFSIVLSADNAIPHLLTDEDLAAACRNMHAKLSEGGLLIVTIRDYDHHVQQKERATIPRVFDDGKRVVFQVWDWSNDYKTYTVNHFILIESEGKWNTSVQRTTYRALLRDEFSQILSAAGFDNIDWHMPADSGYYQPIVTARKGKPTTVR
ncbi:class I SAM-dependent methyltransferase [Paenibacillus nanensis]|uniref:Class I SAM-dependent methyltransferase n=1 Tax=Paenibacillus nanensis TaxID=393251 RepID=A0A3A1VFX6_9BACL|nr:class I SAM-dependent methyltransferase [Paenibacillus nanensis]RIX59214.1 class I SAM-dependent methyltransferase [Paenibacillus nanensis]